MILQPDDVLEWGSGRSTTWFARRSRSVVTIEPNVEWAKKVRDDVQRAGIDNVRLILAETGAGVAIVEAVLRRYRQLAIAMGEQLGG